MNSKVSGFFTSTQLLLAVEFPHLFPDVHRYSDLPWKASRGFVGILDEAPP